MTALLLWLTLTLPDLRPAHYTSWSTTGAMVETRTVGGYELAYIHGWGWTYRDYFGEDEWGSYWCRWHSTLTDYDVRVCVRG